MGTPGEKKLYGLIAKKNVSLNVGRVASVFGNSDDEDEKVDVSNKNRSASSIRVQKEAERAQQLAMAQDPLIFDYDANYDIIQRKKDEKTAEDKAKDHQRESKYAPTLIKAHKIRVLQDKSREERQQQREREKEDGEFADKEVFVTSAYRSLMEEVHKHREEEAHNDRIDEATAIDKQMIWQSGYSRNLLDSIARGADEGPSEEVKVEQAKVEFKPRNPKNIRSRNVPSDNEEDQNAQKKSIYDSDDEDKLVIHKNFEGDLRPGLNKPATRPQERVMTKAERLRRQFTPSDDDDNDRTANDLRASHRKGRDHQSRSSSPKDADHETTMTNKEKPAKKKQLPIDTKEAKAIRLKTMKEILKQRNGPGEIEAARQRFIERRSAGVVSLPL